MYRSVLFAAIVLVHCTAPSTAAPLSAVSETQKTIASVIAIEHHWTRAEVHGDVAYVDGLLLPDYRSVGADGTVHPKSAILASARKNGQSDKMALAVGAFMKSHPIGTAVTIQGDVAVVTFYSLKLGAQKGVMSSDIFMYGGGHWRALYSQHTTVKP